MMSRITSVTPPSKYNLLLVLVCTLFLDNNHDNPCHDYYLKEKRASNTHEILPVDCIGEVAERCGWRVNECDGHDVDALVKAITEKFDAPKFIIAHTIKGRGVSFMENSVDWHYKSPSPEEFAKALKEINNA